MNSFKASILCLFLVFFDAEARAEWRKIAPGPDLDYALAYCDNASMGLPTPQMQRPGLFVGQDGYLYQTPNDLGTGLANLGTGLGYAIKRARFKKNCMMLNGWKDVQRKTQSRSTIKNLQK